MNDFYQEYFTVVKLNISGIRIVKINISYFPFLYQHCLTDSLNVPINALNTDEID